MDEFAALESLLDGLFQKTVLDGAHTARQALSALGVDLSAVKQGAAEFVKLFGNDDSLKAPATAFSFAFALGHAAGIRRATLAAAAPGARGREAELFGLLLKGLSIDGALARLAASRQGDGAERAGNNVIALRPAHGEPGE
jgi:hypothetical protein